MTTRAGDGGMHPRWWAAILVALIVAVILGTAAAFSGTFVSTVPVTLTADRAGLVLESGGKVKMRGVQVGRVAAITGGGQRAVTIKLDLDPDTVRVIPANVEGQIRASTVFGSKYVDLIPPEQPAPQHISAGAVIVSRNIATEVNTVFENLTQVLRSVDPAKVNAVLTALADGLRGKGERIGEATTGAAEVLSALNPRMDTVQHDFQSLRAFSDTYGAAAPDILHALSSFSTTSATISSQASDLNEALLAAIGVSSSGTELIAPNQDNLVHAINVLEPTTSLLMKYSPSYTCTLQGAVWILNDEGGYDATGGSNRRSLIVDAGLLFGDDVYKYPQHLPMVAAKGGPDGKPGCGSLPRADLNFPVRQLVTNTGWGTGPNDIRTRPGLGNPWWVNYFPVTRAVPEPPSVRGERP